MGSSFLAPHYKAPTVDGVGAISFKGIHDQPKGPPMRWTKRVDVSDCWQWTGYIDNEGYGKNRRPGGDMEPAHRTVYRDLVGFDETLVLDHLCFNRACVNPDHIEPVTVEENITRQRVIGPSKQTHCKRGHRFTKETLYVNPNNGDRRCRPCTARRQRSYRQQQGVRH